MEISLLTNNVKGFAVGNPIAANIIDFPHTSTFESLQYAMHHIGNIRGENNVASAIDLHNDAAHGIFKKQPIESVMTERAIVRTGSQDDNRQTEIVEIAHSALLGLPFAALVSVRR